MKSLSDFPKNSGCVGGYAPVCKACSYEAVKARRAKIAGPGKPTQEVVTASEPYPGNCRLCNSPMSSAARYQHHMKMVHPGVAA